MKRRLMVFTGTRAEYGLLRNLIKNLAAQSDLGILASGAHLSDSYGKTIGEIEQDGFAPVWTVDMALADNSPVGVCASMGRGFASFAPVLRAFQPHVLILLGDRYEAFCAAAVASILRIPIAHLHGGEITEGAVDDCFRHAITKLSHLHFTSSPAHRNRVIQMGEQPEHVWDVGAPGVENTLLAPVYAESAVREYLRLAPGQPYLVATWHPETVEESDPVLALKVILEALSQRQELVTVFTGANADAGGERINSYLAREAAQNRKIRFFLSLGTQRYLNATRYSCGVIGNSSSGILEVPALGIPVLDIGKRQMGRECPRSVRHVPLSSPEIQEGLTSLLSPKTKEEALWLAKELKQRAPARDIAEILLNYPLEGLLRKKFHNL